MLRSPLTQRSSNRQLTGLATIPPEMGASAAKSWGAYANPVPFIRKMRRSLERGTSVQGKVILGSSSLRKPIIHGLQALCYCQDCRKISGSTYSTNLFVASYEFRVISGNPKQYSKFSDIGSTMTSHFREDCGVTLWRARVLIFRLVQYFRARPLLESLGPWNMSTSANVGDELGGEDH